MMKTLNSTYWQERYDSQRTGWDIGYASPPVIEYVEQLSDKNLKILIPGAGNAYEASYLVTKGFLNIHILDFAEAPIASFKKKFPGFPDSQIHCENFFEHRQTYDLILEQTFFCALSPGLRQNYAAHISKLLNTGGKLCGLLFDFELTPEGTPFGGSYEEYKSIFSPFFNIKTLERCYNSIKPRMGKELFFIFEKK